MPEFKSKEEYEEWKAKKVESNKKAPPQSWQPPGSSVPGPSAGGGDNKKILAIAAAAVIVALVVVAAYMFKKEPAIPNPFEKTSPLYQPFEKFAKKMLEHPDFRKQFEKVTTKEQAGMLGWDMVQKGISKLDDDTVIKRMQVGSKVLEKVDVNTCADMVRGTAVPSDEFKKNIFSALEQLGPEVANEWFDMAYNALVAQIKNLPDRSVSPEEIETSMKLLLKKLPQSDADKLVKVLSKLNTMLVNEGDACWAGRILYSEALKMHDIDRKVLARAFVQK